MGKTLGLRSLIVFFIVLPTYAMTTHHDSFHDESMQSETALYPPVSLSTQLLEADSAPPAPILLEKDYVQFDLHENNIIAKYDSFIELGMNYLQDLAQAAANKIHSLLSWKTGSYKLAPAVEPYMRMTHFGRWINDPNDDLCYNTRARVLVRDSKKEVIFRGRNNCVVDRGDWDDPYTNETLFESRSIQIDHMVPLKNAYLSGAYKWSFKSRCLYANYMGADFHLISSGARENMRKGDRTPANYIPPNDQYTCTYIRNWLAIKMIWNLNMSQTESTAISALIKENNCPSSMFQMSNKELVSQKQIIKDNLNQCAETEKRRERKAALESQP